MTRETKSYELKIYDQSLMRFEAAYDAFGSLKLEITDIDSANAHLLPLNLIVDQDEKSLASWMEGRTIPKNRAFVEQILSTAGLTRNDILGILDVSKGLSINDSYWLDDGKSDVTFDEINLFDNRFDEVLGLVAYTGYTPSQKHKAGVSSEWTLGGQFPKAVRRINDRLLLFKTGTSGARNLGKEPYSEYFAAQVAKRISGMGGRLVVERRPSMPISRVTSRTRNLSNRCHPERGSETVEYIIVISAVVVIGGGLMGFGNQVSGQSRRLPSARTSLI